MAEGRDQTFEEWAESKPWRELLLEYAARNADSIPDEFKKRENSYRLFSLGCDGAESDG